MAGDTSNAMTLSVFDNDPDMPPGSHDDGMTGYQHVLRIVANGVVTCTLNNRQTAREFASAACRDF
jgi:hypothetical protein